MGRAACHAAGRPSRAIIQRSGANFSSRARRVGCALGAPLGQPAAALRAHVADMGMARPSISLRRLVVCRACDAPRVEDDTLVNARDLASVCSNIKPGMLIRAACPFTESSSKIVEQGVKHMIDLRNPEEWKKDGRIVDVSWGDYIYQEFVLHRLKGSETVWEPVKEGYSSISDPSISLHRISVLDRHRFQKHLIYNKMEVFTILQVLWFKCFDANSLYNTIITKVNQRGLHGLYEVLLDTAAPEFSAAMDVVLQAAESGEPLLFFCKLGKDRTGLLAAMILSIMGADEDRIIDDYSKSDCFGGVALAKMESKELIGLDKSIFQRAPAEAMELTLAYLRDRYGGVPGYLEAAGFDLSKQERLRRALSCT